MENIKNQILKIEKGTGNKKYKATLKNGGTVVQFGDKRYEQYKDSSSLGIYSNKNHLNNKRRENYFKRHSGVSTKTEAIKKELKKNNNMINAKILSHAFLW